MRSQLQSLTLLPLRTNSKCPLDKNLGGTPSQSSMMMRNTAQNYGLMGHDAIQFDSWVPTLQKNLLLLSSSSNVHPEYTGTCLLNYRASCPILILSVITTYSITWKNCCLCHELHIGHSTCILKHSLSKYSLAREHFTW